VSSVGVDIGGTKLLAVRLADDATVVDEYRTDTPNVGTTMVDSIVTAVDNLAGDDDLTGCGVGIAGLVDHEQGMFVWGPHVDGINVDIKGELSARLGMHVAVDNDANMGAVAEHRLGAGRGSEAMLMLNLGTGIGGAIVLGGALYRGRGFAGEFGHTLLAQGGHSCSCGRRGCWETEAAGPALERLAAELIESDPDGSLVTALEGRVASGPAISEAAAAGDPQATALITQIGRAFGRGLASVVSIFDPDCVVIGGGLGSIGETLLDPIRKSTAEARYAAPYVAPPKIVGAEFGERAGAVGAALLALDEVGQP